MRTVVALLGLCACTSSSPPPSSKVAPVGVPTVTAASAVVRTFNTPPLLVIVDREGAIRVALPPRTWTALASLSPTGTPIGHDELGRLMDHALAEDWTTDQIFKNAAVKQTAGAGLVDDDPPPPEDEDEDDDRVRYDPSPGSLSLREEQIRAADGFGIYVPMGGVGFPAFPRTLPNVPSRLSEITGEVKATRAIDPKVKALVMIDPQAKAEQLRTVIGHTRGAIAVKLDGVVTALRTQFVTMRSGYHRPPPWIEVRVLAPDKLEIESPPDVPVPVADRAGIAAAIAGVREKNRLHPYNPVDLLFGPNVDAQTLVDLIVALDEADVHAIGLGPLPDDRQAKLRGKLLRYISMQIYAQGDLDKKPVRELVRTNAVVPCYETALARNPSLAGTLNIQFFVAPNATVPVANATGVDEALATCVADTIKGLAFDKPKGGGGAQFNVVARIAPKLRP